MTGRGPETLRPPDAVWHEPPSVDVDVVDVLVEELRLPRPLCTLLAVRGHVDPERAKDFLRPRLEHRADPALLADGPEAAARISAAIDAGETILLHGDYDVDGICATALLARWLTRLGARVVPFVPHRLKDGYDFSDAGVAAAQTNEATLVVTVDCGTVAHDAVARAGAAGIDVIVTDHHQPGATLPPAVAVVNPHRVDCTYPFDDLCGTGIAFALAELVARERNVPTDGLIELLDLVALATVADLVPLRGENRVLVHFGLRRFVDSRVPGVRALLEVAGVDPSEINAGHLGFQLAPRINAVGRIGDAKEGLELLLTDDDARAAELAGRLDVLNTERRDEDQRTLEEALEQLADSFDPTRDFGVVIAGEGWHPGVIGIVASRVVDRVHRPVVMLALGPDGGRGSARSVPGFHLYEALSACAEHLERFGGHEQAAGMDIHRDAIPAFRDHFNAESERRFDGTPPRPSRRPDAAIQLDDIDTSLVHWLGYLGPHGIGNRGPLFHARGVMLDGAREVGTNHLKVSLRAGSTRLEGIGFGLWDRFVDASLEEGRWDVLFRLERNEWRGRVSAQAKLVDLQRAS
ncbi:MAG: single-stranded-DNA-specific exonuclease RecJ [Gemmatimonadota bacterium]